MLFLNFCPARYAMFQTGVSWVFTSRIMIEEVPRTMVPPTDDAKNVQGSLFAAVL